MSVRRSAEENETQARSSYPLLSRSIQRIRKPPKLLLTRHNLNSDHGSDTRSGDVVDLMVGSSWCQGSADALVNVYSHPFNWLSDVPDWPPITFHFNSPPFKMPAKDPFNFASGSDTFFQTRRPKSLLDIAVPGPAASELTVSTPYLGPTFVTPDSPTSSSLHQLLGTTTSNDISASSTIGAPGKSKSYAQQPADIPSLDTQQRELNPFLSHTHSDVMFPSLGNVIDTLLDDKPSLKLEVDALGCAHLPASEFTLNLESDCNFHYEFWDGFYQYGCSL